MSKIITADNADEYQSAMGLIKNYQDTKKENSIDAHFISKASLQQFIDNPDFDAFKIHHARKDVGTRTLVFEGVNKKGQSLDAYMVCVFPECPPVCTWDGDDDDSDGK